MPPYVESVLTVACIYSLVALGLQFTLASGQFSVMHAALMGAGGYAAGIMSVEFHQPFIVALLAGAMAGGGLGAIVAVLLRRTSGLLLGIVTVALGESMSLVAENMEPLGRSQGYTGIPLVTNLWSAALALVAGAGIVLWINRTRVGSAILAVGKDETVASSLGISVLRIRAVGFGVGGALAGLGGALLAHNNGLIEPGDFAFSAEPLFFVFVIVGGISSPLGAIIGTFLMWWLQEALRFGGQGQLLFLSQSDRYWILGLILIVTIIVRPDGLVRRRPTRYPSRMLDQSHSRRELHDDYKPSPPRASHTPRVG
jgi:branched-chain amino acid transport system permease protein